LLVHFALVGVIVGSLLLQVVAARLAGFAPHRTTVEVEGLCAACR
jgi:hypothetical protein